MTTQPDPNRHEASRAAFEETRRPAVRQRESTGEYASPLVNEKWLTWCAALDWRDSQVCEWTSDPDEWIAGCEAYYGKEWSVSPYCPNCGRRVKIQTKNGQSAGTTPKESA